MYASPTEDALAPRLLAWYDRRRRALPWRAPPGIEPDPYRVWLSEIMLQQTTVAAVEPYFRDFVGRWPTVGALAQASLDDVLQAWQGLGYYARARNLHKCAQVVSRCLGGRFPDGETELRDLPGIGPYTAAAMAAIAFGESAVVVDGNVMRVIARLYGVEEPLPGARRRLRELAGRLTPSSRAGDYAQAVMDLGALVCTPRNPACGRCPWAEACVGCARGIAQALPLRAAKAARPVRRGVAFLALRPDGRVLLRRRPERGLLGGMMEVPSTPWRANAWTLAEARDHAPLRARWRACEGVVRHTFTHFRLELGVLAGTPAEGREADGGVAADGGIWHPLESLSELALPTLMKKVVRHGLAAAPGKASAG